jgi:hypothetical protein
METKADKLGDRSLRIASPIQGQTTNYTFSFEMPSTSTVGSIDFQFCSDTPLIGEPCTAPDGLDVSHVSLANQQGEAGFTLQPGASPNQLTLTRTATPTTPGPVSYTFDGAINPSANGSYFARIQTFATDDASGPNSDYGGLSFVINDRISISTKVPPYLLLCSGVVITGYDCSTANGDYINFGELSSGATKAGSSELVIATNATNGYTLFLDGSAMASGTDVINALIASDVSRPGTSQFGLNLASNSTPQIGDNVNGPGVGLVSSSYGQADRYRFVPGEMLASATSASDYNKYTASYIINMSKSQPPGIYVSTLTYVAVADF